MNLREAFTTLTEQGVKYVVIGNWIKLPYNAHEEIEILCTNEKIIQQLLGLSKISGNSHLLALDGGARQRFTLIKKGDSIFPDKFEAELLEKAITSKEKVKHPGNTEALWMFLFKGLYNQAFKNETERKTIEIAVEQRVGRRPTIKI